MKVRKYMSEKLITAAPSDGARHAFFQMRREGIRHMPVVEDGKLVGIISDRDLRRPDWVDEEIDLAHAYQLDDHMTVGALMTTNVECAHVYDTVHKVVQIFTHRKYGAMPVLNKDDELVGVITPLDLLAALDEALSEQR